jgi:hypothetical protein
VKRVIAGLSVLAVPLFAGAQASMAMLPFSLRQWRITIGNGTAAALHVWRSEKIGARAVSASPGWRVLPDVPTIAP